MAIRSLQSDAHITETTGLLEQAMADAKAGRLASVYVFADLKGVDSYKVYKSCSDNYLVSVGKLVQCVVDICLKHKDGA